MIGQNIIHPHTVVCGQLDWQSGPFNQTWMWSSWSPPPQSQSFQSIMNRKQIFRLKKNRHFHDFQFSSAKWQLNRNLFSNFSQNCKNGYILVFCNETLTRYLFTLLSTVFQTRNYLLVFMSRVFTTNNITRIPSIKLHSSQIYCKNSGIITDSFLYFVPHPQ
jgi:hypothetical protein